MNNAISRALMVLAMAALVGTVGCGDDDVTPGTDSGPGPVDAGPGGTDAGPGMDGMVPMVDAGPGMTDGGGGAMACINATDPAALMARYADGGAVDPDGGMGASVQEITGACGLSCITAADPAACTTTCLRARTSNAISMPCAACYGDAVVCSATNCLTPCSAGPTSAACVACQCGMNADMVNCIAQTAACTGIPSSLCTPPDGGTPAADAGTAAGDAG